MRTNKFISAIFYITGIYDGVLGIVFLFVPRIGFDFFKVTYPNHWGYVQFPAVLLIVFAFMFFAIAKSPLLNRNMIPYGVALKASFSLIVFSYWFTLGIPNMWKPFAVIDFVFGILFIWAYIFLGKRKPS